MTVTEWVRAQHLAERVEDARVAEAACGVVEAEGKGANLKHAIGDLLDAVLDRDRVIDREAKRDLVTTSHPQIWPEYVSRTEGT